MQRSEQESGAAAWWRQATPIARLRVMAVPLAIPVAAITAFHAKDAQSRGESLWPVALGLALVVAIAVGTFGFLLRGAAGEEDVRARSQRLLRWVVPLGVAISLAAAIGAALASR